MAIIFNSKECGITKEEMKLLYRYNLIECNDFTFTVATIPSWAMEEAKNLVGMTLQYLEVKKQSN